MLHDFAYINYVQNSRIEMITVYFTCFGVIVYFRKRYYSHNSVILIYSGKNLFYTEPSI